MASSNKVVVILGGHGTVGLGMQATQPHDPTMTVIYPTRRDADLTNIVEVIALFDKLRPTHVINLAAKNGSMFGNIKEPYSFGYMNITICSNVLEASRIYGCSTVITTLSIAIFPAHMTTFTGADLHNGPPFESHFCYAYAKRMAETLSRGLRIQYGINALTCAFGNVYGPGSTFSDDKSNVVEALIRRFVEAERCGKGVEIRGTGAAHRQLIHSEDLGKALWWMIDHYNDTEPLLIASSEDITIANLASLLSKLCGNCPYHFEGNAADDGHLIRQADGTKFCNLVKDEVKLRSVEEGITSLVNLYRNRLNQAN